jgi:hypothetical protein
VFWQSDGAVTCVERSIETLVSGRPAVIQS